MFSQAPSMILRTVVPVALNNLRSMQWTSTPATNARMASIGTTKTGLHSNQVSGTRFAPEGETLVRTAEKPFKVQHDFGDHQPRRVELRDLRGNASGMPASSNSRSGFSNSSRTRSTRWSTAIRAASVCRCQDVCRRLSKASAVDPVGELLSGAESQTSRTTMDVKTNALGKIHRPTRWK